MSGKHGHKPFEGHMHDYLAHVKAVEEDLEYYRAKRFEPRIFYLLRRNVVTFYDLLKVRSTLRKKDHFFKIAKPQGKNLEARVRHLEEWLDEYVKGIALVSARTVEGMDMVTEDNRKERGDYDDFFKIKKKEHHGALEERMAILQQDLTDYTELLEVFVQALIRRGWATREDLAQRWQQLHDERSWAGGIIVAKAWTDPDFKRALLNTGREALREMGVHQGKVGKLVVVENTEQTHNVVVCTLCSCYPYDILGDTPGGTNMRVIALTSCKTRVPASKICFNWISPAIKNCEFGTAPPTCAILSCPSALPARTACRNRNWPNSSPSTV